MLKQLGVLIVAGAMPVMAGKAPPQCDTGKATSQGSKTVTIESGTYVYHWRPQGNGVVFVINDPFEFCREGSWFVVFDRDGKRHKFSLVAALKRLPQPAAAQSDPRDFSANLKQGPPSFHAAQLDKQWKKWMSTSGPEHYLVRADGEHVYVEQVLDANTWLKIDSTLSGKLYIGTVEYGFANGLGGKPCSFSNSVEFSRVEPSRIEGAMRVLPGSAVIDAACTPRPGPTIERFTWVPE